MGRGKKKKKANPNIEFVSPYPLEDCVWQLQNFPGVGERFPIRTRVEVTQVDEETWEFYIQKTFFSVGLVTAIRMRHPLLMFFELQATGFLRSTSSKTTLVASQLYVSKKTYLVNTLLLFLTVLVIIFLIIRTPFSGQFELLGLFLICGVLLPLLMTLFGLIPNRDQYIQELENRLRHILEA
jgi:hypothetical protein